MGQTAHHQIRDATPDQWRELSDALAVAFEHDPVFSWMLPNAATRPDALRRFFAIEARDVVLAHRLSTSVSVGASGVVGAALVLPPGHWRTPMRIQARHAPSYLRVFGPRLPRAMGVQTVLERRHPGQPHYYLPFIGVRPEARGQGLGSALLQPMLDRCDREGLPAYLEASSPDNARLYRRLGFTSLEVVRPLGAPPLELMIRTPGARYQSTS